MEKCSLFPLSSSRFPLLLAIVAVVSGEQSAQDQGVFLVRPLPFTGDEIFEPIGGGRGERLPVFFPHQQIQWGTSIAIRREAGKSVFVRRDVAGGGENGPQIQSGFFGKKGGGFFPPAGPPP